MAATEKGDLVIRGGLLADRAATIAEPRDILVRDGVIAEIGPPGMAVPEGARILDASGMLLHAGLVNGHTHAHGFLSRGVGDRWTLELLLAASPWVGGARTVADKALSATIGAAEMVLKGCTAAFDMVTETPMPTAEGIDAVAGAYDAVGLRAVIAPMVADRTLYEAIPPIAEALPEALRAEVAALRLPPWRDTFAALDRIVAGWRWSGRDIAVGIGPTIPTHCDDAFLAACRDLAERHGVRLSMHVAESKVQAVMGLRTYGRTVVEHLDGLGLIGPRFVAAHGIWLDDGDLETMARRGATISHNPGSNMKLGNGLFPLRRALDAGVAVGLGTDTCSCGDNLNMYEAMRLASLLSKVQGPDPASWASAEEAYGAATGGSARALGLEGIGRIAVGAKADIVFLDLRHPNWMPHRWTVNQLVHVEDGTAVRHVMVGGRLIVEDGRLTTVDLAALKDRAEEARARHERDTAPQRALFERLAPIVAKAGPAIAAEPYRVRRYLAESGSF
ncbi:amidohydrolase family protein [Elioraea rosea]|uniref:amidohydrolase family protein n=1 Tax=Elioraea rosea TaxID=2492390 RepID=UPI0011839C19|nr:amidohydrolase family protein [Elioraea rosea]